MCAAIQQLKGAWFDWGLSGVRAGTTVRFSQTANFSGCEFTRRKLGEENNSTAHSNDWETSAQFFSDVSKSEQVQLMIWEEG